MFSQSGQSEPWYDWTGSKKAQSKCDVNLIDLKWTAGHSKEYDESLLLQWKLKSSFSKLTETSMECCSHSWASVNSQSRRTIFCSSLHYRRALPRPSRSHRQLHGMHLTLNRLFVWWSAQWICLSSWYSTRWRRGVIAYCLTRLYQGWTAPPVFSR